MDLCQVGGWLRVFEINQPLRRSLQGVIALGAVNKQSRPLSFTSSLSR